MKMEKTINFEGATYAPQTITFCLDGPEELIKLSKEGFYYKGKLIVEDKEIYLRFKEWLDQAHSQLPKQDPQKFNSIEERDNLIGLLQEVLKFYANANNYKGTKSASSCCGGTSFSLVDVDEGSQARAVLERAKQLAKENQKIQDEYDKFMMNSDSMDFSNGETNPIDLIRVFQQTRDDKNIR